MKKLIGAALALCMTLSLCVTTTWAAEELPAASNGVITLTEDVALYETYEVRKSLTIDLNGHSITGDGCRAIHVKAGILTLTGQGTITVSGIDNEDQCVIRVGDNDANNPAAIVVGEGVTIRGNNCYALAVFAYGSTNTSLLSADIYGTLAATNRAGLSGNGSDPHAPTAINVYSGAVITSNTYAAIYHPQKGTLNILGGYIEGATGIEMRARTLTVSGGTIKSNGTAYKVEANGNGFTTTGAAIAVAEHTTKQGVTVKVNGGTLLAGDGAKALSVADPQGVSGTSTNPVTVSVTGGSVNGAVEQNNEQFGEKRPTTITGGTFDTDVTAFVPIGTPVATNGDDYYVGGDNIAAAANSGKDMTMVQGGAIDGLESGAHIIVPQGVTDTALNGEAAEWGDYTIAEPDACHHEPIRRQHTATTTTDTTTTDDAATADTTRIDTVTSAKTFDVGTAVYGVLAVTSLLGMGYAGKKRV